ncbi:hypothetical protein [Pseudonocardia endophytica]|uniref:Uncharacterized protein n=1 Tax=Pseudonocardia endophytica TaxID=401976 RepID=A0A4R1I210_PSEEN|nr:hypothetical protein [Pseudonocardia endophytica]TCK27300.1 hypothetical protein EV378_3168 [Pseudonocardia endophytica]
MFRASAPPRPSETHLSVAAGGLMVLLAMAVIATASAGASAPVVVVLALAALCVRPAAVLYHRRRLQR